MTAQRPYSEVERVTSQGVMRHCIDCEAWLTREPNFYSRIDAHGHRRWFSRCKLCQCAHDSERKARRYAELHPQKEIGSKRGRPRMYATFVIVEEPREAKPFPQAPLICRLWVGVATDLDLMPHLAWLGVCR